MSASLKIENVQIATDGGIVEYSFDGPLTVLSGPVGTGKSTLLELIKFGLGGSARRTPVVDQHVASVTIRIALGQNRYRLTRRVDGGASVTVLDLSSGYSLGDLHADPSADGSLSSFLLENLGLPTDARAVAQGKSTREPPKITFNDIYAYLYVDQPEIDRSIVHHSESYRAPKRRTAFELLFGLSDIELVRQRAAAQLAAQAYDRAKLDEQRISKFLLDTRTESRQHALFEQERLRTELDLNRKKLQRLREEVDPDDASVDITRDLLTAARDRLQTERARLSEIKRTIEERKTLLAGVRQEGRRLERMWDASRRLASIEFVVCPRCSQSINNRVHEPDTCPLCLQPDSVEPSVADATEADSYERRQLNLQADEVERLLAAAEVEKAQVEAYIEDVAGDISSLARAVDEKTRELVSPRLQAYADASAQVADALARLQAVEEGLRLWDGVGDLARLTSSAQDELATLNEQIAARTTSLQEHREEFFQELSEDYQATVSTLGIPSVTEAHISSKSYLPIVDGSTFDNISTGGIRTALIVAYWVTLLATAARDASLDHPRLLIIDSPRKSIGAGEELAENLYRQLDVLAETYKDSVQVIVADNKLPSPQAKRWQQFLFDYKTSPVLYSVPHPGPSKVTTMDGLTVEES